MCLRPTGAQCRRDGKLPGGRKTLVCSMAFAFRSPLQKRHETSFLRGSCRKGRGVICALSKLPRSARDNECPRRKLIIFEEESSHVAHIHHSLHGRLLCRLVAALIVVNRFGSMSTRKLVVIAMMVAVYVVLNTVGTIRLGWINISVSALPIIVGALLYGPGGGLMVGLVGAFLGQLMTYGVTATTVLWIIPPAVRGLLIGLYAKRCGYALSRRQLVGVLIVTSLVVTLLNTGAIYLDSVIYGYYTYAYVFGKVGIRIVSGAVTAVAMAFVTPPVLDMLKRSLRAAQRA